MALYTLTVPEVLAMLEVVGVPEKLLTKAERQMRMVLDKRPTLTDEDNRFEVASGFGVRTQQPHVEFKAGTVTHQMEPKKAQEVAHMLLEGAEAAISDAIVMRFMRERVGITESERLGMILLDLREFRQGSRKTVYPQ
jgi:hypothetical protein